MKRPVIIVGNGVHLAGKEREVRELCEKANIPVLSTWTGSDIVFDLPLHIGHFGIFGDRASNLVVQNADHLFVLGASLCIPQIGYNKEHFARKATITNVDLDAVWTYVPNENDDWTNRCLEWKAKYGIDTEKRETREGCVNSFYFIREFSESLPDDAVVVTDMGTSFTCTFQAAKMKYGQRWFTASGFAPMGYGLPAAIGAHYASGKRVWCLVGDGALQFNIQELQSIRGLPIEVIVFDNGGYLTMKHTQANHFGRYVGSKFEFPDIMAVAKAFGVENQVKVVKMDPNQPLTPRTASVKRPDGSITSRPLEDMYPFLPREEFRAQMIVPPLESL